MVLWSKHIKIRFITILCTLSFCAFPTSNQNLGEDSSLEFAQKPTDESVLTILSKMKDAILNTDYQLHFTQQEANGYSSTFLYRHLGLNNR